MFVSQGSKVITNLSICNGLSIMGEQIGNAYEFFPLFRIFWRLRVSPYLDGTRLTP